MSMLMMTALWTLVLTLVIVTIVTITALLAPVNPDWFNQNGFAFLVPSYPGFPQKKAVKRMWCSVVIY